MIVLFQTMGKAEFQLAYDGPALRGGTMDVNELASSLLAVADLIQETNQELNAGRAEVSVRVRSDFKQGSFEVALLVDQSLLEHAKGLLFPGTAALTGLGLIKILFGTEIGKKGVHRVLDSVLEIWKKLKGEKPKSVVEDKDKGITIIVYGDGNKVDVDSRAAHLYGSDVIRSSIAGMVRPVAKEGIKTLEIRQGRKSLNGVQKSDLPPTLDGSPTDSGEIQGAKVLRNTREALLRVVRANFEKGKWGFSDGTANFSADITDGGFKDQLDSREIGFYKGDTLRVILATIQIATDEGLTFQTKYEIEKVIQHIHAPKQQKLLE